MCIRDSEHTVSDAALLDPERSIGCQHPRDQGVVEADGRGLWRPAEVAARTVDALDEHLHVRRAEPRARRWPEIRALPCLLYTSDAADERSSVDLGGRRIIKKKKQSVTRMRNSIA